MKALQRYLGLMVFVAVLLFATHSPAGGVCRSFTDTRGRTVTGQLIGFDDVRQLVTIQRADNHVTARASLADFSDSDQHYIQAWNFEHDFNESLRISSSRKTFKTPGADDDKQYSSDSIENIGYEVELTNRSGTRFESLEVEYCVFYRQGRHQEGSILFDEGVQYGRFIIESIMPDSETCLKTEPVLILNETGPVTAFGRTEGARGAVLGLWLRIHTTRPSGVVITREHFSPPGLISFKAWTGKTVAVGLNHETERTTSPAIRLGTATMPSVGRLTIQ